MRGFALFAAAVCAVVLLGCAADEGGGGKSFTYTITDSGGTLPVGSSIALVHSKATACGPGGTYSGFERTTSTVITNANGPVVLKFSLDFPHAYLETGYIDVGNSGRLSSGDKVLGPIGAGVIYSICIGGTGSVPSNRTLDWTNDLLPLFGGSTTWTDVTQSY